MFKNRGRLVLMCAVGAVALFAAACSSSSSDSSSDATGDDSEVEFEFLIYNVAGLPDVLSGSEPAVNTELIGPMLNDYDIVLLQETWLTPDGNPTGLRTYHEILEELSEHQQQSVPLAAPLGTEPDRPSAQLSDGLNRFSDFAFEPVDRNRWLTCGDDAADCLSLKGFSFARTTLASGLEVDIYNLHMDAGGDDSAIRAENVAELSAFIAEESKGRAVIVGGDFNLHLDRDPDAAQFADLLAATDLIDVCTELDCDQPNRIDKVLYRSGGGVTLTPLDWQNLGALFTRADGEMLSDHAPVAVTMLAAAS